MQILAILFIVLSCLAATFPQPWPQPRPATLPPPALVRADAGPTPNDPTGFPPVGSKGDAREVPPQSSGVGSAAGSKSLKQGPSRSREPGVAGMNPTAPASFSGRWETRTVNCGPLGQRRASGRFTKTIEVWVETEPLVEPMFTPTKVKPATSSCHSGHT